MITKDTIKVLSIDFDYFQNTTRELLNYYPDKLDVQPEIGEALWKIQYKLYGNKVNQVKLNKELFEDLKELLEVQNENTKVMITEGHEKIYSFITSNFKGKQIEIYNIDMHHDIVNDSTEMDCGNWISHIMKKFKIKLNWMCRQISTDGESWKIKNQFKMYIDKIIGFEADLIFICRSDPWTPPHLDKYFSEIISICNEKFNNIEVEENVTLERV